MVSGKANIAWVGSSNFNSLLVCTQEFCSLIRSLCLSLFFLAVNLKITQLNARLGLPFAAKFKS